MICAAHPVDRYTADTAQLLSRTAQATVTCVNPRAGSFESMVSDLEAARRDRDIDRWAFWGLSGGAWLGMLYARMHPEIVTALIIESCCACFRARVADPACALSPQHPMWRAGLDAASVVRDPDGTVVVASPVPLSPEMQAAMPTLLSFDARPWLADLHLPALVLAGTSDPIVPLSHVQSVADALAARFIAIEGAGHVPTVEGRPEAAAAVRAFLANL